LNTPGKIAAKPQGITMIQITPHKKTLRTSSKKSLKVLRFYKKYKRFGKVWIRNRIVLHKIQGYLDHFPDTKYPYIQYHLIGYEGLGIWGYGV
jgi:hypothetical protein